MKKVEIVIATPYGILMKVSQSMEKQQLTLWNGFIKGEETPEDCAIRLLLEEAGLNIEKSQLVEMENDCNDREDTTYRFIVRFDHAPKVTAKVYVVGYNLLDYRQDFIKRVLGEK